MRQTRFNTRRAGQVFHLFFSWQLVGEVLVLLTYLVQFGYVADEESVLRVVPSLTSVLNGVKDLESPPNRTSVGVVAEDEACGPVRVFTSSLPRKCAGCRCGTNIHGRTGMDGASQVCSHGRKRSAFSRQAQSGFRGRCAPEPPHQLLPPGLQGSISVSLIVKLPRSISSLTFEQHWSCIMTSRSRLYNVSRHRAGATATVSIQRLATPSCTL